MFSTNLTLVYLSRERIARCDFDARGKQVGICSRPCPLGAEVPTLVDAALRLGKRRLGKVWVLSEDVWTQKLSVADDMLRGLGAEEINRALAFEAESLSGQSAADSELAAIPLGGENQREDFWVVQIPTWVRVQTEDLVRQMRGRLAGLIHPGGLPLALSSAGHNWQRLEAWNGLLVGVGVGNDGAVRHFLGSADGRSTTAAAALERWTTSFPGATLEQLTEGRRALPPALAGETFNLADEETLARWLTAWGTALRAKRRTFPCIVPPPRPMTVGQRVAISAALCLAVGAAALTDGVTSYRRLADFEAEAAASKRKVDELAAIKKQVGALEKQKQVLTTQVDRLAAEVPLAEASLAAYRGRWTHLLAALASDCPHDLVVQEIAAAANSSTIRGVSLGIEPLHTYAADLAARLRPYGWNISPTYKTMPSVGEGPLLYEFSLHLSEATVIPPGAEPAESLVADGESSARVP